MTDLIAGRVNYTIDGVTTAMQYVQSGTIRLLGVASLERSPVLPDQPTVSESGVPGFDAVAWYGLFAPAGTPKPIVDLLNRKMNATLADPQVMESIKKLKLEIGGGAPDVLAKRVQTELKKWADLVREKNIRIDP
jgi:tripartite-type tricarboxylate transporter receptor subunit TctC